MTPMSDVMLLLLTFFLMAGTFTKPEPVQVQAPGSISDIKIPSTDILTIYVSTPKKAAATAAPEIFITLDNAPIVNQLADGIKKLPLCGSIKKADIEDFKKSQSIKVSIGEMVADLEHATTDSQFKQVIKQVRSIYNDINKKAKGDNPDAVERNLRIAIKSDKNTPYSTIKLVMNSLQDIQENRYNLLTELKSRPTE